MDVVDVGASDGLAPIAWHGYRIEPRSASTVLGVEPGGATRDRFRPDGTETAEGRS